MRFIILKLSFLTLICSTSFLILAQPASDIIEINITARLPGPPLWQVNNGDHTLWIMADVSPLPDNMPWDFNRVSRIMAQADEYLEKPLITGPITGLFGYREINELRDKFQNTREETDLNSLLSEETMQRFHDLVEKWEVPESTAEFLLEQKKPWFAALNLRNYVFNKAGLVDSRFIISRINVLRRRHNVPVTKSEIKYTKEDLLVWMMEGSTVPESYGTACLEETLTLLEELDYLEERARYWYQGDTYIGEFPRGGDRPFPDWGGERGGCSDDRLTYSNWAQSKLQEVTTLWFENMDRALNTNDITFAVVQIGHLLEYEEGPHSSLYPQSLLSWFWDKGYEIKQPR